MRMIDLSHPVAAGMMVYPGDPEVRSHEALHVASDGVAVTELTLGSHTGTHIDAPSHTIEGGRTIDGIPLDALSGEALVLHVADRAGESQRIDAAMLGLERFASVPPIVAIRTGWDRCFGEERALCHPFLCPEAARELRDRGMRVLIVDTLSPDPSAPVASAPDPASPAAAGTSESLPGDVDPEHALPVHAVVLGGDGAIVENARGLEALGERAEIGIFPLPLAGADGAPARLVAWVDEDRDPTALAERGGHRPGW